MINYQKSPAMELLYHLQQKARLGTSNKRRRWAYQRAIALAIEANISFFPNDFVELRDAQTGAYHGCPWWWGVTTLEDWYKAASQYGNTSAARAIEELLGRKPFLFPTFNRKQQRLAVGVDFTWEGLRVSVTSFDDKTSELIACATETNAETWRTKVLRRFRISAKDLLEERKRREEAADGPEAGE